MMSWNCTFCGEYLSLLARQFGPLDAPWCEECEHDRSIHPEAYPQDSDASGRSGRAT